MKFPIPHPLRAITGSVSSSFSQSLSRSCGAFRKLSVRASKREHDGKDKESSKRFRSNSHSSKLRQQCEEGRSLHGDTSLYETDHSNYSNRIFGGLAISPAGRALSTFRSGKELITALRDAIKGHRSLYTAGNILHRDTHDVKLDHTQGYE